jgi:enoyl-CoA hydratase/carnithine racemase
MKIQDEIRVESGADGVSRIVLARPAKKNAVTLAMWRAIPRIVGELATQDRTRVLVLLGEGADFSAGADIGEFDEVRGDADSARAYERANSEAFAAIRNAPFPTLASISGICFGGGCGLAAACDLRIASSDALFAVPAGRLGLAYPADSVADLVHALGQAQARYMTYTGARIDAAAARESGFLLEMVEPDALAARTGEIAALIAASAPLSVRASKASIRAVLTGAATDLEAARRLGDATFDSADYAEGRAAFKERRAP